MNGRFVTLIFKHSFLRKLLMYNAALAFINRSSTMHYGSCGHISLIIVITWLDSFLLNIHGPCLIRAIRSRRSHLADAYEATRKRTLVPRAARLAYACPVTCMQMRATEREIIIVTLCTKYRGVSSIVRANRPSSSQEGEGGRGLRFTIIALKCVPFVALRLAFM